jgi:hypothetical protein
VTADSLEHLRTVLTSRYRIGREVGEGMATVDLAPKEQ